MDADAAYAFNIVNNEKANSQFNFGMQPVVYSVRVLGVRRSMFHAPQWFVENKVPAF